MDNPMTKTVLTEIIGKTLYMVQQQGDEVIFKCTDGTNFRMWHQQDGSELVTLEEITGDLAHLIGKPILAAEKRTTGDNQSCASIQWTFYCFRTAKGSVDMKWFGRAIGYYSVGVNFEKIQ
jgi:hypothetical protein